MTATDERAAGTELAQVAPGTLAYDTVTNPSSKWDLAKLAGYFGVEAPAPAEAPAPDPMQPTKITPELAEALGKLAGVFGSVVPTEPRKLEAAEVRRLTDERDVISRVVTALGERDKAIDQAMRSHMDALAPEGAPVIAEGVAKGHRLLATEGKPFSVPVEGYQDSWQQRRVAGKSSISVAILLDLKAQGLVTQEEYLALTVPARILDEEKVRAAMRKSPGRFLSILRACTTRKGDTAQLVPPKK